MTDMTSGQDESPAYPDGSRRLIGAVPSQWGRVAALIDAYESGIRVASDGLLALGRAADVDPLRTIASMSADVVRDIGAAQVSIARWLLDA